MKKRNAEPKIVEGVAKDGRKGPMGRIADLEEGMAMALQIAGRLNGDVERLEPVVEALLTLLGQERVQDTMDQLQRQRADRSVELAVAQGRLRATDQARPGCIVVALQYNADGTPMRPGFFQLPFSDLKEELRTELEGKGPGASWANDSARIVIEGVFEPVPPAQPEAPAAEALASDAQAGAAQ